jgi:hypothetical protein
LSPDGHLKKLFTLFMHKGSFVESFKASEYSLFDVIQGLFLAITLRRKYLGSGLELSV